MEDYRALSDREVNEVLLEQGNRAKKAQMRILAGVTGIVIGSLLCPVSLAVGMILIIVSAVFAVFNFVVQLHSKSDVKKAAGVNLAAAVLREVFEDVEYRPESRLPDEVIAASGFRMGYDEIYGDDYVKARYGGVDIAFSDIRLVERSYGTDNDGNTTENSVTTFCGIWLVCDFGRPLGADFLLEERSRLGRKFGRGGIQTDNEAFHKQFYISSENPDEVRRILTAQVMAYIQQLDVKAAGQSHMRFSREGKLYLAVNSNRDTFEIRSLKTDAQTLREQFRGEVEYITQLLDQLRLVDTMYQG